ncbi:MAG: hypothetical protein WBO10_02440 [Pyrinomonadaceae bacterium]
MEPCKASINAKSVALTLLAIEILLIVASSSLLVLDSATGYSSILIHKAVKLFYVELELNVPAFFSTLLLTFAALLLFTIAYLKRKESDPFTFQWTILGAGFLYMSFDEIAAIHERAIEPMRELLGGHQLGIFYFAWVVPAMIIVALLGGYFLKFLIQLPARTRYIFLFAGVLFLSGSLGIEMASASVSESYGEGVLAYMVLSTIEETCEMGGVILFIYGLLSYLADSYSSVHMQFVSNSQALTCDEFGESPTSTFSGILPATKLLTVQNKSRSVAGSA